MKTIAIIDDDIHIGDMLREVLVQEGYSVLRAYSGTEALYLLSQNKPDLVLLDLMLPWKRLISRLWLTTSGNSHLRWG